MLDETEEFLVWQAGELAPAGTYIRLDDRSYRLVVLSEAGCLPASLDGHVALYRAVAHLSTPARQGIQQQADAVARQSIPEIEQT